MIAKSLARFGAARGARRFSSAAKTIFSEDSTLRLLNKYLVYRACQSSWLIKNAGKFSRLAYRFAGRRLANLVFRSTFGRVFSAGETLKDLEREMRFLLENRHVYSVADLSLENVDSPTRETFDYIAKETADLVAAVSMSGERKNSMALKVTSLVHPAALRELSHAQKKLHRLFTSVAGEAVDAVMTRSDLARYLDENMHIIARDAEVETFFSIASGSKTGTQDKVSAAEYAANVHALPLDPAHACPLIRRVTPEITPEAVQVLAEWVFRLRRILDLVAKTGGFCMVDAEQTYVQYAVDSVTRQLQRKYNRPERLVLMNTYQAYLKNTSRDVALNLQECKSAGLPFSAKLVRGAYMTEERAVAMRAAVASPVFSDKAQVDENYNRIVRMVMREMPAGSHFSVASHNAESIQVTLEELRRQNVSARNCVVSFGQLKGLGDRLTFELAGQGEYTYKYLPYGPTHNLVPYLLRRAEEASFISVEGKKQLQELREEMLNVRKLHIKAAIALAGTLTLAGLAAKII